MFVYMRQMQTTSYYRETKTQELSQSPDTHTAINLLFVPVVFR